MESYFQIRWHGRAQQGVVTANQLLAWALVREGKHVQAFPDFGPERGGAPIRAFTRVSTKPIELHEKVYEPDVVIIIDNTLFKDPSTLKGLKKDGTLVLNTSYAPAELKARLKLTIWKICTLDATKIATEIFKKPFFNTAMIGGLARATDLVELNSILDVAKFMFEEKALEANLEAIRRGYNEAKILEL